MVVAKVAKVAEAPIVRRQIQDFDYFNPRVRPPTVPPRTRSGRFGVLEMNSGFLKKSTVRFVTQVKEV